MNTMKKLTTAAVMLSMTGAQYAAAAPTANVATMTVDQIVQNYNSSVDSGKLSKADATKIAMGQLLTNNVTVSDISTYVQKNTTPSDYQKFTQGLGYVQGQANGSNLSIPEMKPILSSAMMATGSTGLYWKGCGLKYTTESILFVAAGTLGIISLCYLHMDHGQSTNISNANQGAANSIQSAQSTYQNAAPNALAAANKDQANIAGDNSLIATTQAEIAAATQANATPTQLSTLNSQLAAAQAQLGKDTADYTSDMSSYNSDLSTYTKTWLTAQENQANNQAAAADAGFLVTQNHDRSVAELTAILAGATGAAGTLSTFGHCDDE